MGLCIYLKFSVKLLFYYFIDLCHILNMSRDGKNLLIYNIYLFTEY